jgi:nucleoside-diphosphate-sugar epimerase
LTGASSFTGYWFVTRLAERGHDVITTFTRSDAAVYGDDVRGQRVRSVVKRSRPLFACRFGDEQFLDVLKCENVDLLCHHGSDVTNYKSPDFDIHNAVSGNTHRATDVAKTLAANGRAALIWTGSVFETGEGAGSDGLPSFSPYGLSKALSAKVLEYYCGAAGVQFGKFVIPHPFGAWEDARFTMYLLRTWSLGDVASVRTPAYVRDNIQASLVAAAYAEFAERLPRGPGVSRTNPSGYVETQGAFTERLAKEMRQRTGWECRLELANQTEFTEPRVRINTQPVDGAALGWDESAAWDEMAQWYMAQIKGTR